MGRRPHIVEGAAPAGPYSGSSLVPMLVSGLAPTPIGMIVALLVT